MAGGTAGQSTVEVVWEGGQRFRGGPSGGATAVLDGQQEAGPSPVDAMLVALAACSAIDVVDIMEKRRTPVASLKVTVDFSRAPSPPRRVTAARLNFAVAVDSEPHHVERAIELSMEKYCSVSNTFAPDTELTWSLSLSPASAPSLGG